MINKEWRKIRDLRRKIELLDSREFKEIKSEMTDLRTEGSRLGYEDLKKQYQEELSKLLEQHQLKQLSIQF